MQATILRSIRGVQRFAENPMHFLQSDRNIIQSSLIKIPNFSIHNM